jgi:hypothetical protein
MELQGEVWYSGTDVRGEQSRVVKKRSSTALYRGKSPQESPYLKFGVRLAKTLASAGCPRTGQETYPLTTVPLSFPLAYSCKINVGVTVRLIGSDGDNGSRTGPRRLRSGILLVVVSFRTARSSTVS